MRRIEWTTGLCGLLLLCGTIAASAQERPRGWSVNYVAPQVWRRARSQARHRQPVVVTGVEARISLSEQVATTTLLIRLHNPSRRQHQAVILLPVPAGAAIRSFDFHGAAKEPTAKLLAAKEARAIYRGIVAKLRDPALLEFVNMSLVRSSVFPVPAGGTQAVTITYEQLCKRDGSRVDYLLPRTQMISRSAVPWKIQLRLRAKQAISTVYSPSHAIAFSRRSATAGTVQLVGGATTEPGAFQLSYLLAGKGLSASLMAYPEPSSGGGYFLLLAGLPAQIKLERTVKREVTLVIDRSGSMGGKKIEQARKAALQVLEGLREGEAFNIIVYDNQVEQFAARPVLKDKQSIVQARAYIKAIRAAGGTNLHGAVLEAVRQPCTKGMLPLVLLLSDGVPTVGQTNEVAIRQEVLAANKAGRRIFSFGIGHDVNVPLMDKLAESSRGSMVSVLPQEKVEVKVASLFARFSGPILSGPKLTLLDDKGQPTTRRVSQVLPTQLPDLFAGDQLVLLGRYRGEAALRFRLSGEYLGAPRSFDFVFSLKGASMRNAHVARLWASRRIGVLVDAIRQLGAHNLAGRNFSNRANQQRVLPADPRRKELVDEIVKLSTRHGVLTEYTAFLSREGTDLSAWGDNNATAGGNLHRKAVMNRTGRYATSQQANIQGNRGQSWANRRNGFFDQNMKRIEISSVQQLGNRAFYKRGGNWVDASVLTRGKQVTVDERVTFGTPRFEQLFKQLLAEHNQAALALGDKTVIRVGGKTIQIVFPLPKSDK